DGAERPGGERRIERDPLPLLWAEGFVLAVGATDLVRHADLSVRVAEPARGLVDRLSADAIQRAGITKDAANVRAGDRLAERRLNGRVDGVEDPVGPLVEN